MGCILEGFFKNESSTRVVVTSEDVEISENSKLQVSFISSRSPSQFLFEVQPQNGITNVHLMQGHDIDDQVFYPPKLSHDQNQSGDLPKQNLTVPSSGFILNLIVLYDNNFNNAFGTDPVARIEAVFAHVQTLFNLPSLDAPMKLNIDAIEYINDSFEAEGSALE